MRSRSFDSQHICSWYLICVFTFTGCIEASTPLPMIDPMALEMDAMTDRGEIDMIPLVPMDMFIEVDTEVTEIQDARPTVEPPVMPAIAIVKLGAEQTDAGVSNRLSCLIYGDNGLIIPSEPTWGAPQFDIRPLDGWIWSDEGEGLITGERSGTYDVKCYIPSLGLRSEAKQWQVSPASPDQIVTRLETDRSIAGEAVGASCNIFDRYGNDINDHSEPSWRIEPAFDSLEMSEAREVQLFPTLTGDYLVTCSLDDEMGADLQPATLEVLPDLPAQIEVFFASGRQVFREGDIIRVRYEIKDQYDNQIIGLPVNIEVSPNLPHFGEGNYEALNSGIYEARAVLNEGTLSGEPLSQSRSFRVEDGAPSVTCDSPLLGAMTSLSPQTISGRVTDLSDITVFTVNGRSATLDSRGGFSESVTPSWGLNIVEILAEDQFGSESVTHCMFFASDDYLSEYLTISNAALLHLDQDAIDDGLPRSPINSLGDLLGGMLNSSELITTIDESLSAVNPIVPTECRASFWNTCLFSAGARYNSTRVNGPNSVSLALRDGGLRVDATIRSAVLGLSTLGTIETSGTVSVSSIRVIADLNVSLVGTSPRITVTGTPQVTIGDISLSLNINLSIAQSVINNFLNLVLSAFEGIVRDQISTTIESYITDEVDALLSSTLSSLDLDTLGFSLNLPRPLGNGNYVLGLSFSLNRLNVNQNRMQIGLKSTVTGDRLNLLPSAGIAVTDSNRLVELSPGFNRDAAGAAHMGLLNSILHRLWRGNYFDMSTESQGVNVEFSLRTPPALELVGNRQGVKLHLGPANAQINAPSLLAEPIEVTVGGWASSTVRLNSSNELIFDAVEIDDLVISSPIINLDGASLEAIAEIMTNLIQDLLDDTLNSALPAFPIPSFDLPNSLSTYGVPIGTTLGVGSLSLSNDNARLIVWGDFQ